MSENICVKQKCGCCGYDNGKCISIENCRDKIRKPEIDEITKDFVEWLDNNPKYVIHEKVETYVRNVNIVTGAWKILEEYENYLIMKEIDENNRRYID